MKTAIAIVIIVGLGVAFALFGVFLNEYIDYDFTKKYYDDAPTITFKAFKTFYALNPSRWNLCSDYVYYRRDIVCFKSFIDYLQYQKFHADEDKRITEANKIRNETEFIKCMQCEINDYRERNINEMKRILEK